MLGGEYYNYDEFQFEAKTQNSPIDDIPTLNVGAKQTYTSTTRTAYRILSGFGRINYKFLERFKNFRSDFKLETPYQLWCKR